MNLRENRLIAHDEDQIYHKFNFAILEQIYNQVMEYSDNKKDTLLLINDYARELKNGYVLKLFNTLVNNHCHLRCSQCPSYRLHAPFPRL